MFPTGWPIPAQLTAYKDGCMHRNIMGDIGP